MAGVKAFQQLTTAQPTAQFALGWRAEAISIDNPTASPILVRIGSREIPTVLNPDYTVPAMGFKVLITQGQEFGFSFSDPTLISQIGAGNLSTRATLTAYENPNDVPTFGAANFLSISLSPLTNGVQTYSVGSTFIFDLAPWGGALIMIDPDNASGQGLVLIEVSDSSNFPATSHTMQLALQAIWPGTPAVFTMPHGPRYGRITFQGSGIAGEPAIAGSFVVRATMAEVQQIAYNPGSQVIAKNYNIPSLSSTSYIFATHNVRAVSIELTSTSGTSKSGELLIEVSNSVAGPWRTASFREQLLNPSGVFQSIYRSVGDLGLFLRLTVFEIANNGPMTGTLSVSIRVDPDLTSIMAQIYTAIGDNASGAGVNVQQNLYWTLISIYNEIKNNTNGWLSAIYTAIGTTIGVDVNAMRTALASVLTTVNAISTSLGAGVGTALANIVSNTSLTASRALDIFNQATNILTSIGGSIGANVASMTTSIGAGLGALVSAISTNITSLTTAVVSAQTRGAGVYGGTFNIAALGFQNIGTNIPGGTAAYIQAVSCEWLIPSNGDPGIGMLQIAWGPVGSASQTFYACVIDGKVTGKGPTLNLASPRTMGVNMPANNVNFWVSSPIQPIQLSIVFYYST